MGPHPAAEIRETPFNKTQEQIDIEQLAAKRLAAEKERITQER